ncbi:MAG: hypothetical protein K8963_08015 [Proteobacteria bacterium]|nr:hypothetical protein [Pseudomonadota bacterium]
MLNSSSRDARQLKGLDSTDVNQSSTHASSDAEIILLLIFCDQVWRRAR